MRARGEEGGGGAQYHAPGKKDALNLKSRSLSEALGRVARTRATSRGTSPRSPKNLRLLTSPRSTSQTRHVESPLAVRIFVGPRKRQQLRYPSCPLSSTDARST
jgi:hypothetical protein